MTLPPTTSIQQRQSGFTLLEIIIVLVVIGTIFGGSLLLLSTRPDDVINTLPREIENLVKSSLEKAKQQKQTHYIHLSKDSIWLSPVADETKPSSGGTLHVPLPKDSTISYKAHSANQWNTVKRKQQIVHLAVSSSGICEHISLRITAGDSYAECNFHPLTGSLIQP